jgi:hypothetical protein
VLDTTIAWRQVLLTVGSFVHCPTLSALFMPGAKPLEGAQENANHE